MVKKTVEIPDELWEEFTLRAVKKFGYYGAIKKAVREAIELWLERERQLKPQ